MSPKRHEQEREEMKPVLWRSLLAVLILALLIPTISCTKTVYISGTPTTTPKANELVEPMSQDELQLSKVVGLSSANIPSGSYVSDSYLGSRTLEIKGKTLTMYCKAKTGNVEDFPQLGLHTYRYILYGKWGTNPSLADVRGIHLTDVVNGNTYSVPFKYLADYQIIVLSGDSYRIK
jgi:hypothetical protein